MNRKILLLFLLFVIIVSGCGRNTPSSDAAVVPTGNIGFDVGDIAPDFSVTDVDGKTFTLSEAKGNSVVVAFFATWCTPCQIEANNLKKVDDESDGEKFEVLQIGVDQRESAGDLKQFKDLYANKDWIVGFGFDVAEKYNVRSLDTTVIINEDGVIVYRDNGQPASVSTLQRWLS